MVLFVYVFDCLLLCDVGFGELGVAGGKVMPEITWGIGVERRRGMSKS